MIFTTSSSKDTERLGARLAGILAKAPKAKAATILALEGDLGAGKTTFTRGLLRGLGTKQGGTSPTFVLMRRTQLTRGRFKEVFHLDVYRLKGSRDLAAIGFKDILKDPSHLVLVEWADKVRRALPKARIDIRFAHGRKEHERRITIT